MGQVKKLVRWEVALVLLLVAEFMGLFSVLPGFSHISVLLGVSTAFLSLIVAALALVLPIMSGGIDLSVGGVASLAAVLVGTLYHGGTGIWLAMGLAMGAGAAVGLINGLVISQFRIDPFIATLGSMFAFTSIASFIMGTAPPLSLPSIFTALSNGYVFGVVPRGFIFVIAVGVIMGLVLHRTVFGRQTILMGQNVAAAKYAGLPVAQTTVKIYVLSGLLSAIAGVLGASEFGAARVGVGSDLLLPAVTIVVLGGVDIFGGRGSVFGVMVSGLFVGYLEQGLLSFNVTPIIVQMVVGLLLLVVFATKAMSHGAITFRAFSLRFQKIFPKAISQNHGETG